MKSAVASVAYLGLSLSSAARGLALLVAAGLVHEIHVVVQPFIGAAAVRPFEGLNARTKLVLLEARPFHQAQCCFATGLRPNACSRPENLTR